VNAYSETLTYLYGLQQRGMKLGLRNVRALLAGIGNPEQRFPTIHIAGTNGKGSTASFLASIFMEAGYRTALYTSPHLVRFTERIRINGKEISERRLVEYAGALRPAIDRLHATFFEATTCIAFQYFADEGAEIGIIETGLGGRLDATNVLRPLVSLITNISIEHREYLGNTVRQIAAEKGGIIKPGVPAVSGSAQPDALRVLAGIARRRKARLFLSEDLVSSKAGHAEAGADILSFESRHVATGPFRLGLTGSHQHLNARLVVAAIDVLHRQGVLKRVFPRVTSRAVRAGLERVVRNTGLRGRLERAGRGGKVIFDVAHNPEGMRATIAALQEKYGGSFVAVFGVLQDKEAEPMLLELGRVASLVIAVTPDTPRARAAASVASMGKALGLPVRRASSVASGMRLAMKPPWATGRVLVTGSHYVVGEAMEWLKRKRA
jgi:dihydrofolate synthase/folylpolyglutamate synthase